MTSSDMHLDTGALALDALPDDERPRSRRTWRPAIPARPNWPASGRRSALLGSVAAEAPPASLRRAVMAGSR